MAISSSSRPALTISKRVGPAASVPLTPTVRVVSLAVTVTNGAGGGADTTASSPSTSAARTTTIATRIAYLRRISVADHLRARHARVSLTLASHNRQPASTARRRSGPGRLAPHVPILAALDLDEDGYLPPPRARHAAKWLPLRLRKSPGDIEWEGQTAAPRRGAGAQPDSPASRRNRASTLHAVSIPPGRSAVVRRGPWMPPPFRRKEKRAVPEVDVPSECRVAWSATAAVSRGRAVRRPVRTDSLTGPPR